MTFTLDVHDLDPVSLLIRDGMISLMKSHAAKYNEVGSTGFVTSDNYFSVKAFVSVIFPVSKCVHKGQVWFIILSLSHHVVCSDSYLFLVWG